MARASVDDVKTLGLCDAYLLLIIPVNVWLGTNTVLPGMLRPGPCWNISAPLRGIC